MLTIAAANELFLKNMTPLWRIDPRLAQRIDELEPDATLEVLSSKAGPPTAVVPTQDGRKIYLHSRYDPVREAKDFCATLENADALCIVLCGMGLGYHIKALRQQYGDEATIFVVEPDLLTIKTAFEQVDLSTELAGSRVEILTTLEKAEMHERLNRHSTMLMLGTTFAVPPASREHHADFHAQARQAVLDFAAFTKMSLVTLVRNASITARNVANNLPTYVCTPPADILRGRFTGKPAILVAAGPSLNKVIDQLKPLRDRAVIIAAQTTLRPLLANGIVPHFVTSLDWSDMSRQFFENLTIPPEVVLVAEPKATWHVIDTFVGKDAAQRGRVILLDNPFAHCCVGEALAKRTSMESGATVMHLAFYLAQWLGCDPIILVGQDLGFTGHCYYAPGVTIHRAWQTELGRFGSLEGKEWERIVRQRAILRKIKDVFGRDLYTDEQMFTYLQQFERDFAKSSAKVIDATGGGAAKRGVTVMSLAETAQTYCKDPLPRELLEYPGLEWFNRSRLNPARENLATRRKELAEFRTLCEETRDLLKELEGLLGDSTKFNRRIVRVDELRTLVQSHHVIFQMVRDVAQLGELQKFAADRRLGGMKTEGRNKAERQLQRDGQLIESLLSACDELENILDQSLARFDEAIKESA